MKLGLGFDGALDERTASFKALFSSGQASHTDVRPDGDGYLDLVLRAPWSSEMRKAQWDLVKFLIVGAPESVSRNPRLLYHCASWIGYGPHMDMLATLLGFGLDPEHLDSSLFFSWPRSSDLGCLPYDLVPDPMFIEFFRACLRRQPGFAGCDDLTEAMLTGEDFEFESALCRAKGGTDIVRTLPNALGQTATHLAISSPTRLERLLEAGADPQCVDRGGLTPLVYAAAYGEQQSFLHLVKYQATSDLKEPRNEYSFLYHAICRRNLHIIESLVEWLREAGELNTAFDVLDYCVACYIMESHRFNYDTTIPQRLFELGADADTIVNDWTLMHFVETPMMSQLVMKAGFTSFHIRNYSGKTPLMQVAQVVDAKTLIMIASLEQDAGFYAQDTSGKTALHHLLSADEIDCGIVFDLLQAVRHQCDPEDVSKWPSAIKQYHAFEEKGLKHTCCRGRPLDLSWRLNPDAPANARPERIQTMTTCHWKSTENVRIDDSIIFSLASVCLLYEQRSVARSKSADTQRKRKNEHYSPQIQVDYGEDERRWDSEIPRVCEVAMDRYKKWLRWCDRNFVKIDIRGGRQNYTEYGWHLVSLFDDKIDELRLGTETWHTAPEQPAET
ncbi:hypothetical protein KC336_g15241 [Hortaea werneckii]|nr:hypothetical protein KC336_g15241 [Hortaea werneckii]